MESQGSESEGMARCRSVVAEFISGQSTPRHRWSINHVVSRAFKEASRFLTVVSAVPEMKYRPPARGDSIQRPSIPDGRTSEAGVP